MLQKHDGAHHPPQDIPYAAREQSFKKLVLHHKSIFKCRPAGTVNPDLGQDSAVGSNTGLLPAGLLFAGAELAHQRWSVEQGSGVFRNYPFCRACE